MQLKNSSTKFCGQEQKAVRNIVVNLCCIFELRPQPIALTSFLNLSLTISKLN